MTTNGNIDRSRSIAPEIRANGKKKTLHGYAALFGVPYSMGWHLEEVHKDAFKNTDFSDVRILLNHNPDNILGRTKSKTARVGVDSRGLWYEVDLPDSPNGQNVLAAAERSDIDQASWGFSLAESGDVWAYAPGKLPHRLITAVHELFDISPVTFPANPQTTASLFSWEATRSHADDGFSERARIMRQDRDIAHLETVLLVDDSDHFQRQAMIMEEAHRKQQQRRVAGHRLAAEMDAGIARMAAILGIR